jgi:hypothetical protein
MPNDAPAEDDKAKFKRYGIDILIELTSDTLATVFLPAATTTDLPHWLLTTGHTIRERVTV